MSIIHTRIRIETSRIVNVIRTLESMIMAKPGSRTCVPLVERLHLCPAFRLQLSNTRPELSEAVDAVKHVPSNARIASSVDTLVVCARDQSEARRSVRRSVNMPACVDDGQVRREGDENGISTEMFDAEQRSQTAFLFFAR